jgi:hypothetical protein
MRTPENNFASWKDKTVAEIAKVPLRPISPQQAERHRIYCLVLMEITLHYWNGNKYGRNFQYPLNERVPADSPGKLGDSYLGHNIAALIVDGNGVVIDLELLYPSFDRGFGSLARAGLHGGAYLSNAQKQISEIDSWKVHSDE